MIKNSSPNSDALINGAVATYRKVGLPEYCGNPLIEALPPMYSATDARDLLKYHPEVDPAACTKPTHIRTHTAINATDFFAPLPIHLALQQQIDRMLVTKNEDANDQK